MFIFIIELVLCDDVVQNGIDVSMIIVEFQENGCICFNGYISFFEIYSVLNNFKEFGQKKWKNRRKISFFL